MQVVRHHGLVAAGRSECGPRSKNEDAFVIGLDPRAEAVGGLRFFAVADGLVGHGGGEIASRLAVDFFSDLVHRAPRENWTAAEIATALAARVREALANERRLGPHRERIGTTFSGLILDGEHAATLHVGDSRIYRLRGGSLELLTEDHSLGFRFMREGTLSPTEFAESPMRHRLYRYFGARDDSGCDLDHRIFDWEREDRFVLATDGCSHSCVPGFWPEDYTPEQVLDVLLGSEACDQLTDNATAIAVSMATARD